MVVRYFDKLFAAALLLAACDDTGAPAAGTTIARDSAGVTVVSNGTEGAWSAAEAWSLDEVLSLGSRDTPGEPQFGRITGVDVDREGNVYVADRQAQNVQVFDASGVPLRTIGQPGEGPGEFGQTLPGVFVADGQVIVPDLANQRVSRFGMDGTFVTSQRIDMADGIPIRFDLIPTGLLVAQRRLRVPGDSLASQGDAIVTLPPTDGFADTLVTLPVGQSVQITGGIPRIRQFEPDPVWDASRDGRLVTALNNEWRFEVYDPIGRLTRVVSRPWVPVPVNDRHRQSVRERLREMYQSQGLPPQVTESVIDRMEFADSFPAFASLSFGPAGTLWVQHLPSGDEMSPDRMAIAVQDMGTVDWSVFDAEGYYLGSVTFPTQFQPFRVLEDRMYGIARDQLGVQMIKVYRVVMGLDSVAGRPRDTALATSLSRITTASESMAPCHGWPAAIVVPGRSEETGRLDE